MKCCAKVNSRRKLTWTHWPGNDPWPQHHHDTRVDPPSIKSLRGTLWLRSGAGQRGSKNDHHHRARVQLAARCSRMEIWPLFSFSCFNCVDELDACWFRSPFATGPLTQKAKNHQKLKTAKLNETETTTGSNLLFRQRLAILSAPRDHWLGFAAHAAPNAHLVAHLGALVLGRLAEIRFHWSGRLGVVVMMKLFVVVSQDIICPQAPQQSCARN